MGNLWGMAVISGIRDAYVCRHTFDEQNPKEQFMILSGGQKKEMNVCKGVSHGNQVTDYM